MGSLDFDCENCMIEFQIRVEPGKSEEEIRSQFPRSIEWLEKIRKSGGIECPVCGTLLPQ